MSAFYISRPETAFAMDGGKVRKKTRERLQAHLRWLHSLPCLVSGRRGQIEAAHIRYADPAAGKRATGLGERPSDMWVVPLHRSLHTGGPEAQHSNGEREWWQARRIDPVEVAARLWAVSGDDEAGEAIIAAARAKAATPMAGEPVRNPRAG